MSTLQDQGVKDFIWATSWENLFMSYANNKGAANEYGDVSVVAMKNAIFVEANAINISARFQLYPPYGFWDDFEHFSQF